MRGKRRVSEYRNPNAEIDPFKAGQLARKTGLVRLSPFGLDPRSSQWIAGYDAEQRGIERDAKVSEW